MAGTVTMREQDVVSAVIKLQGAKSMLIDEWKTSAHDNPPACASIQTIGRTVDEALICLGVDISVDRTGVPW